MNKKLIIIILVAVVVVAGGVGAYFFIFAGDSEPPVIREEFVPLGEQLTINLKYPSIRFLRVGVVLVVDEEGLEEFLTAQNNTIRETLIFVLRDLTEEEARAEGNLDNVRNRLISALNQRLGIDNIVEIRFNDYVVA